MIYETYSDTLKAIAKIKSDNQELFNQIALLEAQRDEQLSLVRQEAIDNGEDFENDTIQVKIAHPYSKSYNPNKLTPKETEFLFSLGAMEVTIDTKVFDELVKLGTIGRDVQARVFEEKQLSPRVTIKSKI